MENEKIKRIAESLGFETRLAWGEVIEILSSVYDGGMEDWQIFNPYENDADAFKVLEALIALDVSVEFLGRHLFVDSMKWANGAVFNIVNNDLKTAICEAYLTARGKT